MQKLLPGNASLWLHDLQIHDYFFNSIEVEIQCRLKVECIKATVRTQFTCMLLTSQNMPVSTTHCHPYSTLINIGCNLKWRIFLPDEAQGSKRKPRLAVYYEIN